MSKPDHHKCGYIAIIGRPNVGKSTLLNRILGLKLSITSRKPQTTRHNLTGIKTVGNVQMVFVDTPGIHKGQTKAINKYMNRMASSALKDVDVIIFVVDRDTWNEHDDWVLQQVSHVSCPVILAVNKLDTYENKNDVLPYLASVTEKMNPVLGERLSVVPMSALKGQNLDALESLIITYLPEAVHFYPEDQTKSLQK